MQAALTIPLPLPHLQGKLHTSLSDFHTYGFNFRLLWFFLFFFLFLVGFAIQGLHLELPHQPFFVKGFLEIGSCELFAQAGFKPCSS
jgi:hypothetical protein